ncbi:hypothetical protein [Paraburkholderia sp. MM5477-R1]|uniref:hypothetical protein n=1 Tax=Paraburkholderia sp. MM5477-R1 TaxID=2991062 RepID=UPI003D25917A
MALDILSLPIDVPWSLVAISQDMYAPSIRSELPPKWRPSIAVFSYEPPPQAGDPPSDEKVTYLKVTASITGYQPDSGELDRNLFGNRGAVASMIVDNYEQLAGSYYPAYSALVQVAVFPSNEAEWDVALYPYFADFEPKKRELIELATDTGENVTQSGKSVSVRRGSSSADSIENSHINRSSSTVGISGGASYAGANVQGSYSSTSGTEDGTRSSHGSDSLYVTQSDASREKRESFSHTTNLSQLYHLLDSYHAGTNRAVFFVNARPHLIQSDYTFVPGPRQLEGVQEFFLVVRRPKDMAAICVEAVLETAHLGIATISHHQDAQYDHIQVHGHYTQAFSLAITESDSGDIDGDLRIPVGYHFDMSQGGGTFHYDWSGSVPAYDYPVPPGLSFSDTIVGENTNNVHEVYPVFDFYPDHVHVHAHTVTGLHSGGSRTLDVTVYCVSDQPTQAAQDSTETHVTLMLTGRRVFSCPPRGSRIKIVGKVADYVAYEKQLANAAALATAAFNREGAKNVLAANALGRTIRDEVISSVRSGARYPVESVDFLRSQFALVRLTQGLDKVAPKTLASKLHSVAPQGLQAKIRRIAPNLTLCAAAKAPRHALAATLGLTLPETAELLEHAFGISSLRASLTAPAEVGPPATKGTKGTKTRRR